MLTTSCRSLTLPIHGLFNPYDFIDFFSDNKDSFQGKFQNGVLEREGKLRLSTSCNRTYEGKWQDGLMEGEMRIDVRNTILCADHVISTEHQETNLVSNFECLF